jgi:hypothetical protein
VFKYPQEYDVYDEKEDNVRKTLARGGKKIKDDDKSQAMLAQFKTDDRELEAGEKYQNK